MLRIQQTIEGFDCKINGHPFGAMLLHSLGGSEPTLMGEHKHTGVSESAAVAAGSDLMNGLLEEKVLPFLRYCLSLRVNKVLMVFKIRAVTSHGKSKLVQSHGFQTSHFICKLLDANFGCDRFRIMPEIVSKLLRAAI